MNQLIFRTPEGPEENKGLKAEFTEHLSQRLREVRKTRKMTQQELADKAGLHLTYVGHLELATYRPTAFVLWKLANVLGISIDELINA